MKTKNILIALLTISLFFTNRHICGQQAERDDQLSFKATRYNFTNGNVGIGLASNVNPTERLHVVGNIRAAGTVRANEVRVTALGADFVFEPDYYLRPLAEIEQFILENKHLPEIAPDTIESEISAVVYPNPFTESFTLAFDCDLPVNICVHLYDINGVLIKVVSANSRYDIGKHELTVKSNELKQGIYFLHVNINQKNVVFKLIKIQ